MPADWNIHSKNSSTVQATSYKVWDLNLPFNFNAKLKIFIILIQEQTKHMDRDDVNNIFIVQEALRLHVPLSRRPGDGDAHDN